MTTRSLGKILAVGTLVFATAASLSLPAQAAGLGEALRGKILLQVESRGEAWYVDPATGARQFMYKPDQAYQVLRKFGVGISNENLEKIPVGVAEMDGVDTDGDGLSDGFEDAIGTDKTKKDTDSDGFDDKTEAANGYNPVGEGRVGVDPEFAKLHRGKIFLQVESHGEAWWVNPDSNMRYYLGRPADALGLMRSFGLGISDDNLEEVEVGETKMDCEEDVDCFIAALEVGQPAEFDVDKELDVFGSELTIENDFQNEDEGKQFRFRQRIRQEQNDTRSEVTYSCLYEDPNPLVKLFRAWQDGSSITANMLTEGIGAPLTAFGSNEAGYACKTE